MGNKITASDLTIEQIQNGIVIYDPDTKDYANNVIEWQVLGKDQDGNETITVQTTTLIGDGASGYGTIVGDRRYDSNSRNILNSELQNWLDTTFYNHLGSDFRSKIIPVTKSITPYKGGDIASMECKLFSLSVAEVGGGTPTYYSPESGAFTYQYYQGINSATSSTKRVHSGGSYSCWWLRSPRTGDSSSVWGVGSEGYLGDFYSTYTTYGPVPACVLPSSLKLEEDANGKYKIIFSSEPVITTPSTDLGNKIAGFSFDYSITDVDAGDTITANIKLDGNIVISDYAVDQTQTYTCTLSNSSFNNLTLGTHTYTITATDSIDNISTVDIVFSKVSKEEKYSSKENLIPIIQKIEVKLENRYTKDEVDDLFENVGGVSSISKAQIDLLFGFSNKLTLPTQKETLTYNGISQSPQWNDYDPEKMTVTDSSGINAGNYTATFTPKDGFVWNDETTISKDVIWTIDKANGNIILSSDSVELSEDNPSAEVTFSGNTGTVSVTSADRSVATASVNGNTITIALPLLKDTWVSKTWNGLTSFAGDKVWTDGDDVYYSDGSNQYILDHSESISTGEEIADTWSIKEWNGLNPYDGRYIWTDGEDIYFSQPGDPTYILDKSTSTWSRKTWNGFSSIKGHEVWTDGDNIYYSYEDKQYILDKSTSTWNSKTWNGITSFDGEYIWTDGDNIYYSKNSNQYILDKSTSTWNEKTWNEHTPIYGSYIWTDGNDIYYSDGNYNFVLNKTTSTWNSKTWNGIDNNNYLIARNIWTDGNDIYYSNGSVQYVLS